jgi:hypothetical protein
MTMANWRDIPVDYVVERAKGQQTLQEATPYRSLLEGWFRENHWEAEGYGALHAIDSHFQTGKTVPIKELVVLPGCVMGRFRNDAASANQLVKIIHEIHRRMTIPLSESRKATRKEDIRQTTWTWPHVMRVMKRRGIIDDNTTKSVFGNMIEKILGEEKVKPNSIRRVTHGNYEIVDTPDYDLKPADKEVCQEILELFLPLLLPRN